MVYESCHFELREKRLSTNLKFMCHSVQHFLSVFIDKYSIRTTNNCSTLAIAEPHDFVQSYLFPPKTCHMTFLTLETTLHLYIYSRFKK